MKHISICICTFKRPLLLQRLLKELDCQQTQGLFTFSVIVADNDGAQSGRWVVSEFAEKSSIDTKYRVEPRQNIALARNKALADAHGDFIAFIDDDEYPESGWLCSLFRTICATGADGVLGPVEPYFQQEPPQWVKMGNYYGRPTHHTGYKIDLSEARTGNLLIRSKILEGEPGPFRAEFGEGGEDVDFFRRMMDKDCSFLWCNEAVVREAVPHARLKRGYLVKRALLRGRNNIKHRPGLTRRIMTSLIAVPLYAGVLPLLFVVGGPHFMTCLIKFCDHSGRLLALLGLNPVRERDP